MDFNFTGEDFLKLGMSLLAGAAIGAEREYKNKNAGFRTIILVTLGSTLFTMLSVLISNDRDFHVVGNIVVGIGFLGAGTIFKEGDDVKGLTTAAAIWISAAIGVAIGAGQYALALSALAFVIIVLLGFISVQGVIDQSNREKTYKITLTSHLGNTEELERIFTDCSLKGERMHLHKTNQELILTYKIKGSEKKHEALFASLQNNAIISEFEV